MEKLEKFRFVSRSPLKIQSKSVKVIQTPSLGQMTIWHWNINGLNRIKKSLNQFIEFYKPDILCLNETKLSQDSSIDHFKYQIYNNCPNRKNYSGVAILHNEDDAKEIEHKMEEDIEGRVLAVEFPKFVVVSVYTPHSGVKGLKRLEYRVETWDRAFEVYLTQLQKYEKPLIVCGDLNIIRHNADIYTPKGKEGFPGLTD